MSDTKAIETFKSMVGFATEGLKALLLVNGGAVVALLTFIGNSKAIAPSAHLFIWPVAAFLLGLALCVAAFCSAYATQYYLYNEQFPERGVAALSHMRYFKWTVALVGLSLVAFCAGAVTSLGAVATAGTASEATSAPASPTSPPQRVAPVPMSPSSGATKK